MRHLSLVLLFAACTPSPSSSSPPPPASVAPPSSSVVVAVAPPPPSIAAPLAPGAPCAAKGYHAPAGALPKLSLATRGSLLDVTYENAGTAPVCLYTHVATHEEHFDWLTVELIDAGGHVRSLGFSDMRDKSAPVSVELAPGQRVTKTVDVAAWAARGINGKKPLAAGTYQLTAAYDSGREDWVWSGKLTAKAVLVVK